VPKATAPVAVTGVEGVDRRHSRIRARVDRTIEQAGLHPVRANQIDEGDPGLLVTVAGLKVMARLAMAAAINFPVSAVAAGNRTDFEAAYWRSVV
jgi:hypothetical protein